MTSLSNHIVEKKMTDIPLNCLLR